jgi:hypothetical protein
VLRKGRSRRGGCPIFRPARSPFLPHETAAVHRPASSSPQRTGRKLTAPAGADRSAQPAKPTRPAKVVGREGVGEERRDESCCREKSAALPWEKGTAAAPASRSGGGLARTGTAASPDTDGPLEEKTSFSCTGAQAPGRGRVSPAGRVVRRRKLHATATAWDWAGPGRGRGVHGLYLLPQTAGGAPAVLPAGRRRHGAPGRPGAGGAGARGPWRGRTVRALIPRGGCGDGPAPASRPGDAAA